MAKQRGILKIDGTIGGMTFYKSALDGYLVREKGGVSGERIANDPNFERTRENGAEFGTAASAGKLLRDTLRNLLKNDSRLTSRLTKTMTDIKGYDTSSPRGERSVGVGIADDNALALLKGFDFNSSAALRSVLFAPFTVTTATGEINVPAYNQMNDIAFPNGATHVNFRTAFAKIDFVNGTSAITYSGVSNFSIENSDTDFSLTPSAVPAGSGTQFYLLLIEFFQEVNGTQYSLRNGAFNVLNIVEAVNP